MSNNQHWGTLVRRHNGSDSVFFPECGEPVATLSCRASTPAGRVTEICSLKRSLSQSF